MTVRTPSTWRTAKLGDIGEALIGLTYEPRSVKRSGTLVLRSSNIQDGRLAFEDNVYVDCAIPDRIRVREQDILICVRNGSRQLIGKSVMLDRRVVGQTFGAFMAIFRSNVNPYLRHFFLSDDFKRQIDAHLGATINQITNASLKGFTVLLPDEAERADIGARLNDADDLITGIERLINKKESIRRGAMQRLLTGHTRLPGFAEPWMSRSIGDVADVDPESLTSANLPNERLDYISLEDVSRGALLGSSRMDFRDAPSRARRVIRDLDVLFGTVRPNLQSHLIYRGGLRRPIASTGFAVIRARPAVSDPSFLFYLVMSYMTTAQVDRIIAGSNYPAVTSGDVRSLRFDMPRLDEQTRISGGLNALEAEVQVLRRRLEKARAVKQGMMQALLTGRQRLPKVRVS